jgi:hypothetical protein
MDEHTMRAADRDRQQVVDRLRGAVADGRLQMDEFSERMGLAYQAVTYGDLAPLCADLPPEPAGTGARPGRRTVSEASAPAGGRAILAGLPPALKVAWTIWFTAVSINVVVWALVSVTSLDLVYPWPLWVAGPWGAALFAVSAGATQLRRGRAMGRGRVREDRRAHVVRG